MLAYTGKIISLAFPDTFVRHSDEATTKVLLALGMGKNNYIKAGHAAFVLIENETGKAEYYDFGRYITPQGYGRVRSALTDVELEIPFRAKISKEDTLVNLEEFLIWLEAHPEKTHGSGRLVASVCDYIDYQKAKNFVTSIQRKGSIPYKAFGKNGSNCSRIVTDTILASTDKLKIKLWLKKNSLFTPSPLGNVQKSSMYNPIYQVENGKLVEYKGSIFKENITNYFDKNLPDINNVDLSEDMSFPENAHLLSGIGSSAYFTLQCCKEKEGLYEIHRYTEKGEKDFEGVFEVAEGEFDCSSSYKFVYDSNCQYCNLEQNGKKIRLELKQ